MNGFNKLNFIVVIFLIFNFQVKANWFHSNSNYESTKLSEIAQINEKNIYKLEKIWTYNSGSIRKNNTVQSTPIFTGKFVIISTLGGELHAIKPENGEFEWKIKLPSPTGRRGFTYKNGVIYVPTREGVAAVSENNGQIIKELGNEGFFGNNLSLLPPIVVNESLFTATLSEGIFAYNLKNGEEIWSTNLTPKEVAPSDGKLRIWSGFSYDSDTKTLFVVTSNMGGITGHDRKVIEKDYSSSVVAINSVDGKVLWSFQDVKNDLWDFDIAGPPVITEINFKNKLTKVLVAASKTGNIIIIDIKKGKLLHENSYELIETPSSELNNLVTSSTQKIFKKPKSISKVNFDPNIHLNYANKVEKDYLDFKLRNTKFGFFLPPSLNHDIVTFALHGGPSWPGLSLTKNENKIILTTNEYPWFIRLFYRDRIFTRLSTYHQNIQKFLRLDRKNKKSNARWANNEIKSVTVNKLYSKIPIIGYNNIYQSKCSSCHGVAGQGFVQDESYGDTYYPALTGITLTDKKRYVMNYQQFKFAHKYMNEIDLSKDEFEKLKKFFIKRDKFLKKYNLLAISGRWQLFLDKNKLPASKPPWGKLVAVDIKKPEIIWERPFGIKKDKNDNIYYGDQNFGGILNLASNIFFATGTTDEKIFAHRTSDGHEIWSDILPAAGSAPPMSFKFKDCQYIVVSATGGRFFGFKKNLDATVAYKLNDCK